MRKASVELPHATAAHEAVAWSSKDLLAVGFKQLVHVCSPAKPTVSIATIPLPPNKAASAQLAAHNPAVDVGRVAVASANFPGGVCEEYALATTRAGREDHITHVVWSHNHTHAHATSALLGVVSRLHQVVVFRLTSRQWAQVQHVSEEFEEKWKARKVVALHVPGVPAVNLGHLFSQSQQPTPWVMKHHDHCAHTSLAWSEWVNKRAVMATGTRAATTVWVGCAETTRGRGSFDCAGIVCNPPGVWTNDVCFATPTPGDANTFRVQMLVALSDASIVCHTLEVKGAFDASLVSSEAVIRFSVPAPPLRLRTTPNAGELLVAFANKVCRVDHGTVTHVCCFDDSVTGFARAFDGSVFVSLHASGVAKVTWGASGEKMSVDGVLEVDTHKCVGIAVSPMGFHLAAVCSLLPEFVTMHSKHTTLHTLGLPLSPLAIDHALQSLPSRFLSWELVEAGTELYEDLFLSEMARGGPPPFQFKQEAKARLQQRIQMERLAKQDGSGEMTDRAGLHILWFEAAKMVRAASDRLPDTDGDMSDRFKLGAVLMADFMFLISTPNEFPAHPSLLSSLLRVYQHLGGDHQLTTQRIALLEQMCAAHSAEMGEGVLLPPSAINTREGCVFCKQPTPLTSLVKPQVCPNGHHNIRCAGTGVLIDTPLTVMCALCGLRFHPVHDMSQNFTFHPSACPCCGSELC